MQQHHGDEAELIVALAPEHVEWVRRNHPHVAHKTVTLKRLVKHLSHDRHTSLAERVAALRAHEVELEPWEEVVDPGGGEVEVFIDCAIEVVALCDELCPRL
jgi:protein-tyrosine-phosphatase